MPASGTSLTRVCKGKEHRVTVREQGFRYDGREFRSLTALAQEITGYSAISGPAFFGIAGRKAQTAGAPAVPATTRGTKRAAKVRRAGRDPQPVEPKKVASESAPPTDAATA
jgi:hypothetical protein